MQNASRALAAVAICLAAAALAAWATGAVDLLAYRYIPVKANSALGILLCGAALWCAGAPRATPAGTACRVLCALAAALGAATMVEHVTGADLGIDQLLVTDTYTRFMTPGRMSAVSAADLMLFAAACITAAARTRTAGVIYIAGAAAGLIVNYLAIIGHIYDVTLLYGSDSPFAITPLAAAAFLFLFFGLALVRPDLGWVKLVFADAAGGTTARRILPMLVLVVPVLGWLRMKGEQAGYFDTHAGLALFAIANIILLSLTVLVVARRTNQVDADRAARTRELAYSEERYRTVVDLLQECIYIYRDGRVVYVNKATREMLAASEDDIIGRPAGSTVHPDDRVRARAAMQAALISSTPTPAADYRVRAFDGQEYITEGQMTSFDSQSGRLVLVVARNVTAQRAQEAQLREIQKLEAVGQLTGGIAHDFNNLLAVIISNAEDIADHLRDHPDYHDQAELVLQAARRGADLVKQLLAYSRKQLLHPAVVDPRVVLESFLKLLRRTLPATIEIRLASPQPTPAIHVDRGMLENALLNLAVNARDAMPGGGVITISAAAEQLTEAFCAANPGVAPGSYVRISVRDTGQGMSADILRRVFEPFFTTKEVGKGTGLGLSMVYGFAKQSGGAVTIGSEPGVGTAVNLFLPCHEAQAHATPQDASRMRVADRFTGRALLVEDNDMVQATAAERLRRMGFDVTVAGTAHDALDMMTKAPGFALVLSDVIMPGAMTGADLAREIERRWPATKVLLTSGYTGSASLGKVDLPPGIKLLPKPYAAHDLAAAIRVALDRANA